MGRRKLEMKRIEDKNSRLVTFSKRRTGLVKKARHLSILCDVDVAVIVFSARGKLYEFSSGSSVDGILSRYQKAEQRTTNGAGEDYNTQLMMEYISTLKEKENKLSEEKEELEKQVKAATAALAAENEVDDGGGGLNDLAANHINSPQLVTLSLFNG